MMFDWIFYVVANSPYIAVGLGFAWLIAWGYRTERAERAYDGVPKPLIRRSKEINAGIIPDDMATALKQWLPDGSEEYTLKAEVMPIFQERDHEPTWCVRVIAEGDGIDSGFDALFNRHGEILTS